MLPNDDRAWTSSNFVVPQTGKFVSRNRDLGCATFSERARRRAKFKNIASGAQILKVRAQKMKIV